MICWLVVSNMVFIFHHILGMSSQPEKTNSIIVQDVFLTTNQYAMIILCPLVN